MRRRGARPVRRRGPGKRAGGNTGTAPRADPYRTWTRRQDLTPSGPDDPAAAPVTVQLAVTVDAARWAAVRGVALPAAADDLAAYLREQVESELVGPLHPALLTGAVSVEDAPADRAR